MEYQKINQNIKPISIPIANFIFYIHFVLVLYVLIGFYFTPIKFLHWYLFLIIFIFLDWSDLDGQCILTKLEHYFRTGQFTNQTQNINERPEFFRPLINKIFNINLNYNQGSRLNTFVFILCFLFGFIRLLNHYSIIKLKLN